MGKDFRPNIHFTAPKNWINDPNGMVYFNGEYHLFYQHYPEATNWGPMHWGHAVTRDLIHWEHKPVALYPDELGFIFSGSAVIDKENVSGFGVNGKPPIVAVFTNHGLEDGKEVQSIAYSTDYEHFEKYYGNPVIVNEEKNDFRDPKVFYNPIKKGFSLVVAAGEEVEFYFSKNLKDWEKTGTFKAGDNGLSGICECPDCFPLETEEGTKWVLIISMIIPNEKRSRPMSEGGHFMSHVTQYYIGDFDGYAFIDTERCEEPMLLDFGTDNYAAVTFQNLAEKVMIGWGDNWAYANETPSKEFSGKMTLARKMAIVKTDRGLRVSFVPEGLDKYRINKREISDGYRLHTECFGILTEGEGSIRLYNENGEEVIIKIDENEVFFDRSRAGLKDFNDTFASESYNKLMARRLIKGRCKTEIIFDTSFIEVFADEGLMPISASVYPKSPYERIEIEGDLKVKFYEID